MTGTAAIDHDLPCTSCGYNLRTLATDALCPECGRAVGESIRSDGLRLADLNWLKRIRVGITLAMLGLLAYFVLQAAGFCMVVVGQRDWSQARRLYEILSGTSVAAVAIALLGVLVMAVREPRPAKPRNLLRGLVIAWALVEAVQLLLPTWPRYLQLSDFEGQLIVGAHTGLRVAAIVTVLLTLRQLAQRNGRRRLARETGSLALLFGLAGLALLIAWFQITFNLPATTSDIDVRHIAFIAGRKILGLLSVLGGGVLLLFYRRMLSSLIRYGKPEGTTESHGSHRA